METSHRQSDSQRGEGSVLMKLIYRWGNYSVYIYIYIEILGTYKPLIIQYWGHIIFGKYTSGKIYIGEICIYIYMYNKPLNYIISLYEIISWGMRIPHHPAIIGYLDVPRILTYS